MADAVIKPVPQYGFATFSYTWVTKTWFLLLGPDWREFHSSRCKQIWGRLWRMKTEAELVADCGRLVGLLREGK